MPSIGRVNYSPDTDTFEGFLKTMTVQADIRFLPIANPGPNGPNYRILASNGFELGAAWKKQSQQGAVYISASFDAPEFQQKLYANLGREAGQDDEDVFAVIWNRN